MSAGAAGGAAAAAAQVAAAKASFGPCLRVEPAEFLRVVSLSESPLVAACQGWQLFGGTQYKYLTSYKGLTFFAKSDVPLELPAEAEVVAVEKMSMPNL